MTSRIALSGLSLLGLLCSAAALAGNNTWTVEGPAGAPAHLLAGNPQNPNVMVAAIPRGLARTTNGGETWEVVTADLLGSPQSVAFHPTDNAHIVFSTGLMYLSEDGGQSFALMQGPEVSNNINRVTYGPDGTLFATSYFARAYKAQPPYANWTELGMNWPANRFISVVVVDPSDPQVVYIAIDELGMFRSNNGGTSFNGPLTTGIPSPATTWFYEVAIDPANPARVIAATSSGIYVSTNNCTSWVLVDGSPTTSVAFNPHVPGHVTAVRVQGTVMLSVNNGATWAPAGVDLRANGQPRVRYGGSPTRLVFGSDHGVSFSTDEGASHTFSNGPITGTTPGRVVMADDGEVFIAANAALGSIFRRVEPEYQPLNPAALNSAITGIRQINALAVSATNSNILFAVNRAYELVRTTDGGAHWSAPHPQFTSGGVDYIVNVEIASGNPNIAYVGRSTSGLWKTTNGGATWAQLTTSPGFIYAIGINPADNNVIYVGGGPLDGTGIYKSTNGGATWTQTHPLGGSQWINGFVFDPVNSNVVYATGPGVLKSINGGSSWSPIDFGVAAGGTAVGGSGLLIDPLIPTTMIAINDQSGRAFMRSVDGGVTWTSTSFENGGYPLLSAVLAAPGKLVASAHSIGMVEYTVAPDLSVSLSAIGNPLPVGATTAITVTVTNHGPHASSASQLVVTLPAWLSPSVPGNCTRVSQTLTCEIGVLQVNASRGFTIDLSVSAGAPGQIGANINGHESDADTANNAVAIAVSSAELADIDMTLTPAARTIDHDAVATLTAAVVNHGPSPSTSTLLVLEQPDNLTLQSVTPSRGTCTTLLRQITCNLGTLANNDTANVALELRGTAVGTGNVSASLDGAGTDPDGPQEIASASIRVRPVADISVSLAESADPVSFGAPLQYVATVANNGGDLTAVQVGVNVTAAQVTGATVTGGGTCTTTANSVTCAVTPVGPETVTINLAPASAGVVTATATVGFDGTDPVMTNNTALIGTTVRLVGDVSVEIVDNVDPATVNVPFSYTATVRNLGPNAGAVHVSVPVTGGSITGATASAGGTCATTAAAAECDFAALANGASATVAVNVNATTAGTTTANATATFSGTDLVAGNNTAAASTTVNNAPPPRSSSGGGGGGSFDWIALLLLGALAIAPSVRWRGSAFQVGAG